jgi:hypothetical protein
MPRTTRKQGRKHLKVRRTRRGRQQTQRGGAVSSLLEWLGAVEISRKNTPVTEFTALATDMALPLPPATATGAEREKSESETEFELTGVEPADSRFLAIALRTLFEEESITNKASFQQWIRSADSTLIAFLTDLENKLRIMAKSDWITQPTILMEESEYPLFIWYLAASANPQTPLLPVLETKRERRD